MFDWVLGYRSPIRADFKGTYAIQSKSIHSHTEGFWISWNRWVVALLDHLPQGLLDQAFMASRPVQWGLHKYQEVHETKVLLSIFEDISGWGVVSSHIFIRCWREICRESVTMCAFAMWWSKVGIFMGKSSFRTKANVGYVVCSSPRRVEELTSTLLIITWLYDLVLLQDRRKICTRYS